VFFDKSSNFDGDKLTGILVPDSDNDGLKDGEEYIYGTNPTSPDTDRDGLSDKEEISRNLNPLSADTDGDGWPDGIDLDPRSSLIPNIVIVVIILAFATIIIVYYYKLKKHRKIRNKSQSVKPLK